MAVLNNEAYQDKVLSGVPAYAGTASKNGVETALQGKVGKLAIGKPGDITSRAFGPVVTAGIVGTAAGEEFGAFVSGKGVVVNSNDVANKSNYDVNFKAAQGQTVGYLTWGTCVVKQANLAAIQSAMNTRVLYGESTAVVSGTGITTATLTAATFGAKVGGVDGIYKFTYDTAWKLNGASVTLSDYGLVASGAAASGDTITVTYFPLCDIEVTGFKA